MQDPKQFLSSPRYWCIYSEPCHGWTVWLPVWLTVWFCGTGEVGVDASRHITGPDFSAVINKALELPGFTAFDAAVPKRTHTVGFGHSAVLSVADQILGAVKGGQLSHIFLVGGCDGNEPQRKYYQRLHAETPSDAVVITLGCGKFRILGQVCA